MNTRHIGSIIAAAWCTFSTLYAQDPLITTASTRPSYSLNGYWRYIVDPYDNGYLDYRSVPFDRSDHPGSSAYFMNAKPADKSDRVEYNFDGCDSLRVPGDWNSQKERLYYYEGSLWYEKSFEYHSVPSDRRVFLYFGAVNYRADVYVNGQKLGEHIGGFTPFNFDISAVVKGGANFVVLRVNDMRLRDGVPTLNTDWWNYGGITRDVKIIEVPATFIRSFTLQLDKKENDILSGSVHLAGSDAAGKTIAVALPELNKRVTVTTNADGAATIRINAKDVRRWSPDHPKLYTVTLQCGGDAVYDRIGFRIIETRGRDILLNGKPVFLRGVSMHEENPLRGGRAYSMDDAKLLLGSAKELGCNFVRLAHYPHNEHMPRLADSLGILVWEEIPVYWTIQWENKETFANASAQLRALIERDRNRASVIIWSMANETPVGSERMTFLKNLADTARSLDTTRLISAALELHGWGSDNVTETITDPFADYVDVLSFNEYIGWYVGLPDRCEKIHWNITQNKPVIISEFGGGAKAGFHADSLTRWSEEYQEYLYKQNIAMLQRLPQLRGMTPWILFDFRSPRRALPGIQDEWNRKGLISNDGKKKKAYTVLRNFYSSMQKESETR